MSDKPIVAVVDDNAVSRETLAVHLEDNYVVRQFDSGDAALAGLGQGRIDLMLLDVEMPGLDGYATCRALRAAPAHGDVPVIFVSAHTQVADRLKGYAAGGDDYLPKPCAVDELLAKVAHAIDTHRRARRLAGEVDDLSTTALITAEMLGDVGVVLEFQRATADCGDADSLAEALLSALARYGLEGCLRLTTARGSTSRSQAGPASALEASLLDHLAARPDTRIATIGQNLGFSYGSVTLLARSLSWSREPHTAETRDAMGRARDNVALLVEGAVARLRLMDAEQDARALAGAHALLDATRTALREIEDTERALHADLDGVFEAMREEFEMRFPQLGLTADQEDALAHIVSRHRARALAVLEAGRAAEAHLRRLAGQLERGGAGHPVP
jgi:DNA-binding response OmpR family regulator